MKKYTQLVVVSTQDGAVRRRNFYCRLIVVVAVAVAFENAGNNTERSYIRGAIGFVENFFSWLRQSM